LSVASSESSVSLNEFVSLPENPSVEWMLICGVVWGEAERVPRQAHSRAEAAMAQKLVEWT
jgi:hypothetical protein